MTTIYAARNSTGIEASPLVNSPPLALAFGLSRRRHGSASPVRGQSHQHQNETDGVGNWAGIDQREAGDDQQYALQDGGTHQQPALESHRHCKDAGRNSNGDRKRVVSGKSVSGSVTLGGRRI